MKNNYIFNHYSIFFLVFAQKDNFVNLGPNIKIFKSGKPNNLVTESKCRQIASSIGKPYGAGSWPGDPKGCFIENNNSKAGIIEEVPIITG